MVGVYNFRVWNSRDGRYWIPPFKATRDFIRKSCGKPIASSQEEVLASNLDDEGRYFPQDRFGSGRRNQGNK
jgi:hypothetical protein